MNLVCKIKGHQWQNDLGGYSINCSDGSSNCYRCGYREVRGDDPASWFDYPGDVDSWGELNLDKIPEGTSVRSGRSGL